MKSQVIEKIISDLKKEKGVKAIYLFGSQVSGKTKPYSDVDICVLTNRKMSISTKESILRHSSENIDISIFWDLPQNIRYRVLKEGKMLVNNDDLLVHRTTNSTVLSYLDFKHVLDRHIERMFGESNA